MRLEDPLPERFVSHEDVFQVVLLLRMTCQVELVGRFIYPVQTCILSATWNHRNGEVLWLLHMGQQVLGWSQFS